VAYSWQKSTLKNMIDEDMNSLPKNCVSCIIVIILTLNLGIVTGNTAQWCAGQSCCCSGNMPAAEYHSTLSGKSAEHGCCSSSTNIPCNLNQYPTPHAKAFIVSSERENRQDTDALIIPFVDRFSFSRNSKENGKKNQFWLIPYPIPLYIQNLTFIC